jgi:hypothetical protein
LKANIKKYQAFIEEEPDESLCRSHNARVKELQARLNDVQAKIRDAERQNRKPPKPMKLERGKLFVPDLRELLNGDVAMVAEVIRSLSLQRSLPRSAVEQARCIGNGVGCGPRPVRIRQHRLSGTIPCNRPCKQRETKVSWPLRPASRRGPV